MAIRLARSSNTIASPTALGTLDGTPSTWHQAVGIYLDEIGSSGATIRNNVISGCSHGIDLHKSYNASVLNNTIYNNSYTAIILEETAANEMYGITVGEQYLLRHRHFAVCVGHCPQLGINQFNRNV